MKFWEFLAGLLLGGGAGIALKDRIFGTAQKNNKQAELDGLYAENEKFHKRNKELERQVEDLFSELDKIRRKAKDQEDDHDDLQDELDKAKRELKNLRLQNDELANKVKEYKSACEAQEAEIKLLKQKN